MSARIAGLGLAAVLTATVLVPAQAAPFMANSAMKSASQVEATQVRYYRGWGGAAVAAGVIGGLALGAAAASQPYYGPPTYYGAPPAYYAPAPVYSYPAPYGYYNYSRDRNSGGNW